MSIRPVISIENLGKVYSLSHQVQRQRYVSLRDVLANKLKRLANRKERNPSSSSREDFWALRNVNVEVNQGDVVGIIGRNGAGKSTLLKVLSRITEPSEGRVRSKGRLASLLEVGTGFHPELTGRENIFLNGAILGMTRVEIRGKFDEIVAFAEVERFLDTPVKHYSSGMYVRLAFAVAAHLQSEILVVDEVLAVGDSEFQKKCLGRMSEVSREGRTVLFVSHNMAAVKSLTTRGIVLNAGKVVFDGSSDNALQTYVELASQERGNTEEKIWGRGVHTAIQAARLVDANGKPAYQYIPGTPLIIEVELETDGLSGMSLELFLTDSLRGRVGMASTYQFHGKTLPNAPGVHVCHMELDQLWLASGQYFIEAATSLVNIGWDHRVSQALEFEVAYCNPRGLEYDFKQSSGFGDTALVCLRDPKFTSAYSAQHSIELTVNHSS